VLSNLPARKPWLSRLLQRVSPTCTWRSLKPPPLTFSFKPASCLSSPSPNQLPLAYPPTSPRLNPSIITIINSAGAGSHADTFIYTAALSTVSPTGNVTVSPTGALASVNNLQPDPTNLQVRSPSPFRSSRPAHPELSVGFRLANRRRERGGERASCRRWSSLPGRASSLRCLLG
jgi:hypothetical protein